MERITKRYNNRVGFAENGTPAENMCKFPIVLSKLAEYEDTGLTPQEIEQMKARMPLHQWAGESPDNMSIFGVPVSKLIEWSNADKQGRLIAIPCRVGDTVWTIENVFNGVETVRMIGSRKIDGIGGNYLNPIWMVSSEPYEIRYHPSEFGKSVFLSREEAETVLKST